VSRQDALWFGSSGALVWGAASLFYLAFAQGVIERDFWIYAMNAGLVAVALVLLFEIVIRLRAAPPGLRPRAALTFSAPGVAGAILLAANLSRLAPQASPGRYVALLLVAYRILIALAVEKTRAVRARGSDRKAA
jgi:hypothetical protein